MDAKVNFFFIQLFAHIAQLSYIWQLIFGSVAL